MNAAVGEALSLGVNPTLLSPLQVELAERLVELIPAADQVTFLKTGSDAIGAAVRLARAVTGRRLVLQWGFHGWHDWCAQSAEGVLPQARESTIALHYNDLDGARELVRRRGGEIACIVVMPYDTEAPDERYLPGLQALARDCGALFVLDEIRSGFRLAIGGAQAYFGLDPDLAAFGKAMANGHAISALTGRREVMRHILDLGLTVTYYRSPDAMAAALATLDQIVERGVPDRLDRLGRRLFAGLGDAFAASGVAGGPIGLPATPFIRFEHEEEAARARAMRYFCNGMLERGILMTPAHHWFLCAAMTEADMDRTAAAAAEVLSQMRSLE